MNIATRTIGLAAGAVLALASATSFAAAGTLRVQFGAGDVPAFGAPYVAKETGLYEKAGLDVELVRGRMSQDAVNAVIQGNVDLAFALGINLILTADKGQDLVAVANFYGRNAFGLIADKKSGVEKLTDLPGHSVLLPGGIYETLLRALVADAGADPEAVTYTIVNNPGAMVSSYAGGQGDAMVTVIPFAYSGAEGVRPSTYIPFADVGDPEPLYVFVARPETLKTKGEEIRAFLQATFQAMGAVNADRKTLVAPYMASVLAADESKVVPDYERWMEYQCPAGVARLGEPSAASWDEAIALYRKVGLVTSAKTAADYFTDALFEGPDALQTPACPE